MAPGKRKATGDGEECCDEEVKDFYGVYLLVSHSEESKYKGRTYIGYTVNPNRRITQHNRGTQSGGAKRTSNKGPWKMVLIVHGFPNSISALRFEWAWQQPKVSRRLKTIKSLHTKKAKESHFQHKFRILTEMLRIGPWNRLPLKIRWLCEEYFTEFPPLKHPPMHMIICYGRVTTAKAATAPAIEGNDGNGLSTRAHFFNCKLCKTEIESDHWLSCINRICDMKAHSVCLAREFLKGDPDSILPIEGDCPGCHKRVLWGDLIRRMNGALDLVDVPEDEEDCDEEEVSDVSSIDGEEED